MMYIRTHASTCYFHQITSPCHFIQGHEHGSNDKLFDSSKWSRSSVPRMTLWTQLNTIHKHTTWQSIYPSSTHFLPAPLCLFLPSLPPPPLLLLHTNLTTTTLIQPQFRWRTIIWFTPYSDIFITRCGTCAFTNLVPSVAMGACLQDITLDPFIMAFIVHRWKLNTDNEISNIRNVIFSYSVINLVTDGSVPCNPTSTGHCDDPYRDRASPAGYVQLVGGRQATGV